MSHLLQIVGYLLDVYSSSLFFIYIFIQQLYSALFKNKRALMRYLIMDVDKFI